MIETEQVSIGDREYTFTKMNFLVANKLFLKLVKCVSPIIGAANTGDVVEKAKAGGIDIAMLANGIQEVADESLIDDLILPIFQSANVAICGGVKLNSQNAIDANFSVDEMMEFWELVYAVLEFNFKPFFTRAAGRFGAHFKEPAAALS